MLRSVSSLILFNHFGHHDEVVCGVRRIGERRLAGQAGMGNILAEDIENRVRVGRGLHIRNIERLELLDIFQHAAELRLECGGFFVGEFDAGQAGDISDIKVGTAHARVLVGVRGRFVQKFDPVTAESLAGVRPADARRAAFGHPDQAKAGVLPDPIP